jgi:poly(3-hydroxybutyrate) depolymerase
MNVVNPFALRLLLALLVSFSAHAAGAASEPPRPGRYRGDIADPATGRAIMKVALQAPEKLPAQKRLGLLFLFHGFKGHENNYIGLTVDALKRLKLLDQYVVISGKSQGPGWTTADDEPVLRIIRWAQETYPIDPRRIFVFGSSNGAAYVGRFGSAHQELLAGVVGYCGNYRFDPALKERPSASRNEWYFVHGGSDNPQNSRRACAQLKAAGYHYIFRQMDGYGHTDIWDGLKHPDRSVADAVRDDWLLWMHALRHKERAPAPEEQQALDQAREKFKAAQPGDVLPLLAEVARIGGEPASPALLAALESSQPALRSAAARTAERTIYGPAVVARLIALLRDSDDDVRAAAIRGLAGPARWCVTDAQAALCRLANAKGAPLTDRVRAIEALRDATRLALLGNFDDGLPVWTLAALLDDDRPEIRKAALAALSKRFSD